MSAEESSQATENLWPHVIQMAKLKAPAAILKEQASRLGEMTQHIVVADVRKVHDDAPPETLKYAFVIAAPALNNYQIRVFEVEHQSVDLYPVMIESTFLRPENKYSKSWKASNEAEFRKILKQILSDPRIASAIQSLIAQSEAF